MTDGKTCDWCGKLLTRKEGEKPLAFRLRHYCDRACAKLRDMELLRSAARKRRRITRLAAHISCSV